MNTLILALLPILVFSKIEVDVGGKLGIVYADEIDTIFGLQGLEIDRAAIEVVADLPVKTEAEIEVDFADGVNLKTAQLRYDPFDFLSLRAGRQKIPMSREELGPYFKRPFMQHTCGNRWADNENFLGRNVGVVLKGKIPLGKNFEMIPYTGAFVSPVDYRAQGASRVVFTFDKHKVGFGYSSRETLFAPDSLLWGADLHLDFPISCDAEALIAPRMQAFSVVLEGSFFADHLKPAVRYEWFDETENPDPSIQELSLALVWKVKKPLRLQADVTFPLQQNSSPTPRMFAGVKARF